MKRLLVVAAVVVLSILLGAGPALAQEPEVVAPPGNSAVEEYLEVVPGAGGDRPATGAPETASGKTDRAAPRAVLGDRTAAALNRLGPDGRAAAAAAAATAPATAAAAGGGGEASKRKAGGNAAGENLAVPADNDGGRTGAVAEALAGRGGGMGLAFPLALLAALAGALGIIGARRIAARG